MFSHIPALRSRQGRTITTLVVMFLLLLVGGSGVVYADPPTAGGGTIHTESALVDIVDFGCSGVFIMNRFATGYMDGTIAGPIEVEERDLKIFCDGNAQWTFTCGNDDEPCVIDGKDGTVTFHANLRFNSYEDASEGHGTLVLDNGTGELSGLHGQGTIDISHPLPVENPFLLIFDGTYSIHTHFKP